MSPLKQMEYSREIGSDLDFRRLVVVCVYTFKLSWFWFARVFPRNPGSIFFAMLKCWLQFQEPRIVPPKSSWVCTSLKLSKWLQNRSCLSNSIIQLIGLWLSGSLANFRSIQRVIIIFHVWVYNDDGNNNNKTTATLFTEYTGYSNWQIGTPQNQREVEANINRSHLHHPCANSRPFWIWRHKAVKHRMREHSL